MRERPANPDAVDLSMRGWAAMYEGVTPKNQDTAIGYFDQALRLDPEYPRALIGKAQARVVNLRAFGVGNSTEVLHDAEQTADRVLAARPDDAWGHFVKAEVSEVRAQFDAALAELNAAIASDRNFAPAHAELGNVLILLGRAPEAFKPIELAMRLDPRDAGRSFWEWFMCHAHAHLGEWDQAVEWCEKSIATNPKFPGAYIDLAAAYGWLGRLADANDAAARLYKLTPGVNLGQMLGSEAIDNPNWRSETERIAEGLRKAGLGAPPKPDAAGASHGPSP